jgi:hypothetical protein
MSCSSPERRRGWSHVALHIQIATMLSEKAKGKQRAVDVSSSDHGDGGIVESRARDLVVRFTEGIPDLTVSLRQSQSVKDLKKSARWVLSFVLIQRVSYV